MTAGILDDREDWYTLSDMSSELITVTQTAADRIQSLASERDLEQNAIRVRIHDLAGRTYTLQFIDLADRSEEDTVVESAGVSLVLDPLSRPKAVGATLDYVEDLQGTGFKLSNPETPGLANNPLALRVQHLIDERVAPSLAQHGGNVSLLDVQEGRVFVEFGGGCQGCGMVDVTLKEGIVKMLQEEIPEISEVLDTTDHAAGTNPYFNAS